MEKEEIIKTLLIELSKLHPDKAHMCAIDREIKKLTGSLTYDWKPIVEEMINNNWIKEVLTAQGCYRITEEGRDQIV